MNDEQLRLRLEEKLQALPRSIEPPHREGRRGGDLWNGVAARIAAQNRAKRVRRIRVVSAVTTLAMAASIALAFGVSALRSQATARNARDAGAVMPALSIAVGSVNDSDRSIVPDPTPSSILPEEPSYRAAANALRTSLVGARADLPEETAIALDADLNLIDAAIDATRAALAKNPDDPNLRAALRDAYQQEIDVLSDVIDLTTRT